MSKVTKAQEAEWEKKYPGFKKIVIPAIEKEVEDENGQLVKETIHPEKIGYLRRPDRQTIKYASAKLIRTDNTVDTLSGGEIVLKKCWIGGDPEILKDDVYFFRACMEANTFLNEVTGFI